MKREWKQAILAIFLGLLLPGAVLRLGLREGPEPAAPTERETTAPETLQETASQERTFTIPVILADGSTAIMELDSYLTGVVLGEMPAEFEAEALKAQAVVARTYTLRVCESGTKHSGEGICTDSSCCQSFLAPEDYIAQGGTEDSVEKIRRAVAATHSQVLTYEGKLIQATYFSCSGGRTEDAVAVWGSDVPYLQATDSPGEEGAAHYSDTVYFSASEFSAALGGGLTGSPTAWLGAATYTDGGGVDTMVIGGVTYPGTTLRQLLSLRSTAFTMKATGDGVTITTRGFGHRVGMSQYGADAMALAGSTCEEILSHYYQGAVLESRELRND